MAQARGSLFKHAAVLVLALIIGGCGGIRPIAELPVNVGRRVLVDLPVGLAKDSVNAVVETVTGWKPFAEPAAAPKAPAEPAAFAAPPAVQPPAASSPEAQDEIALAAARRAEIRFKLTVIGIVGSIVFALMLLWEPTRAFAFPVALGFSGMGTVIVAKLVIMDVLWLAVACVAALALYLLGLLIITAIKKKKADKTNDVLTDAIQIADGAAQPLKKTVENFATARGVEDYLHGLLVKKGYAKKAAKKKSTT